MAAVQLAARIGARVIGTGTKAETLAKLREFGLNDAIVVGEKKRASRYKSCWGGTRLIC
nr:hypothetical protein [Serratia marcescens]